MSYKYRVFLKSGASFDVETDHDLYECHIDGIEDYFDKAEYSPCHFSTLRLNRLPIAFILKKEIAAILVLNGNDSKDAEPIKDDERARFLSMLLDDLPCVLNDKGRVVWFSGMAENRIRDIQGVKGRLLTLSELLEFRKDDLLEIHLLGKKTVNEFTDFLYWLSKQTKLSFKLRDGRNERTPFVDDVLKVIGKNR